MRIPAILLQVELRYAKSRLAGSGPGAELLPGGPRHDWHGNCFFLSREHDVPGREGRWNVKHPVDAHVGKRVRHRRWMVGMTQQQLADKVGIKFQQIQKYETGMNRVSASRLWEIAAALEVPIAYFFDGIEAASAQTEPAQGDYLADKEALELVRSYYAIPEPQRRRLFDLARVLSEAA
jgi:transcriptional regulator with XRE-family HTH domain